MGSRCTGDCCRVFTLPYGPRELAERVGRIQDGEQIAAMVRHLASGTSPPTGSPTPHDGLEHHWYTCSNLGPDNDCAAYTTRPAMCRDFPYNAPCPYPACALEPETRPHVPLRVLTWKTNARKFKQLAREAYAIGDAEAGDYGAAVADAFVSDRSDTQPVERMLPEPEDPDCPF